MFKLRSKEYQLTLKVCGYEYPFIKTAHYSDNNWLVIELSLIHRNRVNEDIIIKGPYMEGKDLDLLITLFQKGDFKYTLLEQVLSFDYQSDECNNNLSVTVDIIDGLSKRKTEIKFKNIDVNRCIQELQKIRELYPERKSI